MKELLQKLFIGHAHKWEIILSGRLVEGREFCGNYYNLQCQHCGKIKLTKCVT